VLGPSFDLEVIVNLNRFVRAVLKTGLYVLEQSDKATTEIRERVKDQVEAVTDRTRQAIVGPEDHAARNLVRLAAGIGLGVVVAMLFAPASGEEIRRSVVEKAQSTRARVRKRFSPEKASHETGGQ
jgi:gas vesicle protein